MVCKTRDNEAASTTRTRESLLNRLQEAFPNRCLQNLKWSDYPEVFEKLGWAESSYSTALRYIGSATDLPLIDNARTYIPTCEELQTLALCVDADAVMVMMVTGCRVGELWRMNVRDNCLTIHTLKGGRILVHSLEDVEPSVRAAIERWVVSGSKVLSYVAFDRRWRRAKERGLVSKRCVPHSLRHRAVTLAETNGVPIEALADMLGHRSVETTKRYKHNRILGRVSTILVPEVMRV